LTCSGPLFAQKPRVAPPRLLQQGNLRERPQYEREEAQCSLLQPTSRALLPSAIDAENPWPALESPHLPIHKIVQVGDSGESFQWVLDDPILGADSAICCCLGIGSFNVAAEQVQQALPARDFVTSRIMFRAHIVATDQLTLNLIPGRVRTIRFGQPKARANAWSAVPAQLGDVLNLRFMKQALDNFKQLPTVKIDIQIETAESPCQSDLIVNCRESLPFRMHVTMDDSSAKGTGGHHGSAPLSHNHWLMLKDPLHLTVNPDRRESLSGELETKGRTVRCSVSFDHLLLGLTQSVSNNHQSVYGRNQGRVHRSQRNSAGIRLALLVHGDVSRKITASLKGWLRKSTCLIEASEVQTQSCAIGNLEFGFGHRAFIGRATLDLSLSRERSTGAFNAPHAPKDAFDEGTSCMRITTRDANLSIPFSMASQELLYESTLKVKSNGTLLTPKHRFAIGGRYTVHGLDGRHHCLPNAVGQCATTRSGI
jgi:hemolysin activation/secretion protein